MARILAVEDSAAMRGLIASLLDGLDGCEIVDVDGGFNALRQLPQSQFDLVITDINMPDINGLELLSFVRTNAAHARTPVLIVTSETNPVEHQRGLDLGANAVLVKPFSADDLISCVRGLLAKT